MTGSPFFLDARRSFHAALMRGILRKDAAGVFSNADKHNTASVSIAAGIAAKLGSQAKGARLAGQMAGNRFEAICAGFIEQTFSALGHLRPGSWEVKRVAGRDRLEIARYEQ